MQPWASKELLHHHGWDFSPALQPVELLGADLAPANWFLELLHHNRTVPSSTRTRVPGSLCQLPPPPHHHAGEVSPLQRGGRTAQGHFMTRPACRCQGGKHTPRLVVSIGIRVARGSQQPVTVIEISRKRSETQKTTHREERENQEEMAKYHETTRPENRTSDRLRGVRRRQRRQRKTVTFTTAKQPLPPFFLFMAQHRAQLQKSNPHWTVVQTATKLGEMWHNQPERDKKISSSGTSSVYTVIQDLRGGTEHMLSKSAGNTTQSS
ncbi:PREDICTED: uncharacterized protein LOC103777336 [Merops nubicus]|uniref:uncharacterized protein LOC103777336 n=1 Tax=Merops nubicus TaxID=57421 RepID=UPI0004F06D9E|nr:PREDICTED: uncharacterized protein LOC103777336 [Merops nubicus]